MRLIQRFATGMGAALLAVGLIACSTPTTDPTMTPPAGSASATASQPLSESKELTVVTHDSFKLTDALKQKFAAETGYKVTYVAPGDGGVLVNQLILTRDAPLGDVVFGIDNTYAGRAVGQGVIADYQSPTLPLTSEQFDTDLLTPIDFGDVCINADAAWFQAKKLSVPTTIEDLTKPEYKDLLVVSNPASSSPGLAFLAATVGAKGDPGYLDYWGQLKDNGVKVVKGWSEAYYTEFSGGEGKGPRPLVLSYATSPAFTLSADKQSSTTVALLGTCFRQIEYAGVIKGAKNEVGARKFIDFLLSREVQAGIPENMYMYPVVRDVELPAQWVKFAPLSEYPIDVPADDLATKRDTWIKDWTAKVIG